jgi:hypothetical protein
MAVSLPSDIVLDVVKAADPAKYQAATKRLSELSGPTGATEFANVFNAVGSRSAAGIPLDPHAVKTAFHNQTTLAAGRKDNAHEQFEAFVLQTFVESMMPKDAESVFGKGTAGSIWKSMMAEQMAGQLAKAGGIGIAAHILAARSTSDHPEPDEKADQTAGVTSQL